MSKTASDGRCWGQVSGEHEACDGCEAEYCTGRKPAPAGNGRRFIPAWLAAERERCMATPLAGLQPHNMGGFIDFYLDSSVVVRHMRGVRWARAIMDAARL